MTDIALTGSVSIDADPAQAALVGLEAAATETTAAITAMGDDGAAAVGRLIASFAGLADSADAAATKISAGGSRIVSGLSAINAASTHTKELSEGLSNTAAILTLVSAGAMSSASHLDYMMATTAANAGMSNDELLEMRQAVLSIGQATGSSFDQLADGFMQVHNYGFKGAEAVHVLSVANMSAVSTGAEVSKTASILANALHEYGASALDASRYMNTMHMAAQDGNMTLEQFTSAMGPTIGVAANLGVALWDVSAAESTLAKHGLDAAEGATQLKSIMEHIVNPVGVSAKALKALSAESGESARQLKDDWSHNVPVFEQIQHITGVDLVRAFSMAGLHANTLSGTMQIVSAAVGKHREEVMQLIPALRGGFGAMILAGTGAQDLSREVDKLHAAFNGKLDPTTRDFNRTMQTTQQQFAILSREVEYDAAAVGEKLLPSVIQMLPALKALAEDTATVLGWFSRLPAPIQQGTYVIGGLTAANVLLGGALGNSGLVLLGMIRTLPAFTGATVAAAGATAGEGVAGTVTTGVLARLAAAYGYATETTVGFTVAGGADITVMGGMTTALGVLATGFETLTGFILSATMALGSFLLEAAPLAAVVGGIGVVGDELYQTANYDEKASAQEQRGDAMPDVSPYINKESSLYKDEREHPGNKEKDEKQLGEIKDYLAKILGHSERRAAMVAPLHHPIGGHEQTGKSQPPITGAEAPGKKTKKGKGDEGQDITETIKQLRRDVLGLDMPTPEILGKLVTGSKAVEIAAKLMSGEIKNASIAQKAFIVSMAEADDRLKAGKGVIGEYENTIRSLTKEHALGKDATEAEKLAYDFHREGLLKAIPISASMTAAEKKSIEAQNAHIEAVNKRLTADRQAILSLTQENSATDILTAAKEKLRQASLSQTQADILALAGSQANLNALTAYQRATLALTVGQTEQADAAKTAYTSALGVLDDYIRKGREAAETKGPVSFTQQAQNAVDAFKGTADYSKNANDPSVQAKMSGALAAGRQLDSLTATDDIKKWQQSWDDSLSEMIGKMSGTWSEGTAAFNRWKRDSLAGLASVKAALGDNYQAWETYVKGIFDNIDVLQQQAKSVDDYRKSLAEVNHLMALTAASSDLSKFQLQQQTYNPDTGKYESPAGITPAQQKTLFNEEQAHEQITAFGDDFQSVFTQSFEKAYTRGMQGFTLTFNQGITKMMEDWAAKFVSGQMTSAISRMLARLSGAGQDGSRGAGAALGAAASTTKGELGAAETHALTVATTSLATAQGTGTAAMTALTASVTTLNATMMTQTAAAGGSLFPVLSGGSDSAGAGIGGLLPGFADGGTFDGSGPIMVGENGPEPLFPSSGGRVISNTDAMRALAGRGGGDTIHNDNRTTIHVKASDSGSFVQSRHQITSQQSRAMSRAKRR